MARAIVAFEDSLAVLAKLVSAWEKAEMRLRKPL